MASRVRCWPISPERVSPQQWTFSSSSFLQTEAKTAVHDLLPLIVCMCVCVCVIQCATESANRSAHSHTHTLSLSTCSSKAVELQRLSAPPPGKGDLLRHSVSFCASLSAAPTAYGSYSTRPFGQSVHGAPPPWTSSFWAEFLSERNRPPSDYLHIE